MHGLNSALQLRQVVGVNRAVVAVDRDDHTQGDRDFSRGQSHDEEHDDLADRGVGAKKRFTAMKFKDAAEKMSSPAISMPIKVRRRINP
jgi:hypothetical protein